jgi:acylphosphatase
VDGKEAIPGTTMRRLHAIVRGEVQGVCYRMFTREQALRLGLCGWVRNRTDGTVELMAEGPEQSLSRLVDECRRGPPAARVTDVVTETTEAVGDLAGFRIVH